MLSMEISNFAMSIKAWNVNQLFNKNLAHDKEPDPKQLIVVQQSHEAKKTEARRVFPFILTPLTKKTIFKMCEILPAFRWYIVAYHR